MDGAIIVIDLVLGIEKLFLEKHPTSITTMAFYENKSLISGSICGRVNISDLENLEKQHGSQKKINLRFSMCQNMQDRKIPVATVKCSQEFGIAMAIDLEGNCRFYDMLRFKKMAKITTGNVRMEDVASAHTSFRLLPEICVEMVQDAFIGVIQGNKIFKPEQNKSMHHSS